MKKAESMDENLELVRFTREQMIECPRCHRASPPNRTKCLYCGAALPLTAENLQLRKKRKIEAWEKAFNLVFIGIGENYNKTKLKEASKFTDLAEEELRKVIHEGKLLPIARVESNREAEALKDQIKALGILTSVIPDENLSIEKPPRRLRCVEFIGNTVVFTLFNSNDFVKIESENLSLLVVGMIFKRQIESIEERKKKTNKLKESSEIDEDETLIDIYTTQDHIGYRITTSGFDFSSALGNQKEKLAHKNIPKLIKKFCEFAPNIRFIDDYFELRHLLGKVWHIEEQKSSFGLRRKSFGGYELMSKTFASNLDQFTKYSRLQNLTSQIGIM
jgi:hypothetical protein